MNQSRWCVTTVSVLGALACSDPVPPAAQGAFITNVTAASPAVPGKNCPAGAAFTSEAPTVTDPTQTLSATSYKHKLIDGEGGSEVACTVKGASSFTFSGRVSHQSKVLELSGGTLGADLKGTARVTILDGARLSGALSSAPAACTIDAAKAEGNSYQVKAGSIWARYSCPAVESQPSSSCRAEGYFVLENCLQE